MVSDQLRQVIVVHLMGQMVEKQVGSVYQQVVDMVVRKEVIIHQQLAIVEEAVVQVVVVVIKAEDTMVDQMVVMDHVVLMTLKELVKELPLVSSENLQGNYTLAVVVLELALLLIFLVLEVKVVVDLVAPVEPT